MKNFLFTFLLVQIIFVCTYTAAHGCSVPQPIKLQPSALELFVVQTGNAPYMNMPVPGTPSINPNVTESFDLKNDYFVISKYPGGCGYTILYVQKIFFFIFITLLLTSLILSRRYIFATRKRILLLSPLMIVIIYMLSNMYLLWNQQRVEDKNNLEQQKSRSLNYESYETGKLIQHKIEEYNYSGNDNFPNSLSDLIPKYMESIPLSPIEGREYKYSQTENGQNYTLCFPQVSGEKCEDSWSR